MRFAAHILQGATRRAFFVATILLCAWIPGSAQGLYNASTIRIDGVEIHVDGEIENSGVLNNNGVITFTGNWSSIGTYNGEGSVEAHGHAPQKIAHHGQQITRLSMNGWGTKYITGKLIVDKELILNQGIVEVSSDDILKLNRDATVTGGSPVSFVDGALTVEGNGYKFFPIGKNGTYAPIEFLNVKGPLAEYSMEVFENPPLVPLEEVVVKNTHYWQRKDIVGTFGSTAIAIDYDASQFSNRDQIILVTGEAWDEPFAAVRDVEHSEETEKIVTRIQVTSPIIMLGEVYDRWMEADFYLPSALSPNASHLDNRKVKVFGDRLADENFHFQVFNRWGELVYESSSLDDMASNGWDGRTRNGTALTTGTYPYRLTAFDKIGRKFEKKGVITIVH